MNALYYGDNLDILRNNIKDESVDLIYLDPPFNSNANYNVLFKSHKGHASDAQITAFEDTWHWSEPAERAFSEILQSQNTDVAEMIRAFRSFLGESDMMAYLAMMAVRLLELHRVLKPTGSLYLHCDPTASHYLKILLDSIFGAESFLNEIIWRRTGSHNSARRYGPIHDTILFYGKTKKYVWNKVYRPYLKGHVETYFKKMDDRGRYWSNTLTGAGTRNGESGMAWKGFNPTEKNRHWAVPGVISEELGIDDLPLLDRLDEMYNSGYINLPSDGSGLPEYRQYLHQSKGGLLQDIWAYQPHTHGVLHGVDECIDQDVKWLGKRGDKERLGYPTQKPRALLERIIKASSNDGDIILDPFCGCGTSIDAAQNLKRQWIGIDITHLAIALIENRLKTRYPGIKFDVHGTPKDLDGARDLAERDKYQFQWWACALVNAQPYQGKKKGADGGIDGLIFFQDEKDTKDGIKKIVVSVKGGGNVTVAMVRDLGHVVQREKAAIGLFVTLTPPTKPMQKEAAAAGFYDSPSFPGQEYPKLQILTIEGLLSGQERPRYPDMAMGGHTFKKATKEKAKGEEKQGSLF